MILRLRVSNYKSIRDESELTLVATKPDEVSSDLQPALSPELEPLPEAVRVAAVFGANASGKSNLLEAVHFLQQAVAQSHLAWSPDQGIPRKAFCLDEASRVQPTLLEIDFVLDGVRHQYGFEVSDSEVVSEWLYFYPRGRRRRLFEREAQAFTFGPSLQGENRVAANITRRNSLFLSAAATANHPQLTKVFGWFGRSITILHPRLQMPQALTIKLLKDPNSADQVKALLRMADLGIVDASVEEIPLDPEQMALLFRVLDAFPEPELPERDELVEKLRQDIPRQNEVIRLSHSTDAGGLAIPFDEESLGTRVWFSLIGYVIKALGDGGSLFIDELDASLHPILISEVIKLFQDGALNTRGAQLVFTSHDTTPLGRLAGSVPLRRDQVWLVAKSIAGVTEVTPMTDFRPRKGENLQRGYLQGRYGGVPSNAWFRLVKEQLEHGANA